MTAQYKQNMSQIDVSIIQLPVHSVCRTTNEPQGQKFTSVDILTAKPKQ
jgi:hypothetical protein